MGKIKGNVFISLIAFSVNMLLAGIANAKLSMDEREHVQAIVVSGEILAFIVAVLVVVFVWNLSKRDIKKRDSKEKENK